MSLSHCFDWDMAQAAWSMASAHRFDLIEAWQWRGKHWVVGSVYMSIKTGATLRWSESHCALLKLNFHQSPCAPFIFWGSSHSCLCNLSISTPRQMWIARHQLWWEPYTGYRALLWTRWTSLWTTLTTVSQGSCSAAFINMWLVLPGSWNAWTFVMAWLRVL